MSLKVKEFCSLMEQWAPKSLCEDYDNVGLMVGNEDNIVTSILVALDCTLEVIEEAKEKNCNLIFTHHPLLFKKPSSITSETLLGKKIIKLIKSDINLFSSHTNLDVIKGGINDKVTEILGFNMSKIIEPAKNSFDEETGFGRMVEIENKMSLGELCELVKEKLFLPALRYIGDDNRQIKTVAIVNGSGNDYLSICNSLGADCVITGDVTYHYASDYREMNLSIIDAGHFSTEWYALKKIGNQLQQKLENLKFNNRVLFSNVITDPYKTR